MTEQTPPTDTGKAWGVSGVNTSDTPSGFWRAADHVGNLHMFFGCEEGILDDYDHGDFGAPDDPVVEAQAVVVFDPEGGDPAIFPKALIRQKRLVEALAAGETVALTAWLRQDEAWTTKDGEERSGAYRLEAPETDTLDWLSAWFDSNHEQLAADLEAVKNGEPEPPVSQAADLPVPTPEPADGGWQPPPDGWTAATITLPRGEVIEADSSQIELAEGFLRYAPPDKPNPRYIRFDNIDRVEWS